MVQGKICPQCGYYMYALSEEEEPGGTWILYECRSESCKFQEEPVCGFIVSMWYEISIS